VASREAEIRRMAPSQIMARFYTVSLQGDLLDGDPGMGRIGSLGWVPSDRHCGLALARASAETLIAQKWGRGYRKGVLIPICVRCVIRDSGLARSGGRCLDSPPKGIKLDAPGYRQPTQVSQSASRGGVGRRAVQTATLSSDPLWPLPRTHQGRVPLGAGSAAAASRA
jgi:hypothetical protein